MEKDHRRRDIEIQISTAVVLPILVGAVTFLRVASSESQVVAGRPTSMPRSRLEPGRGASGREQLVRRMAGGDQAAMAELYDQTSTLVYSLALRIVGEPATAEDVAVEVYSQAWKQASGYDSARGSALTWLLTL